MKVIENEQLKIDTVLLGVTPPLNIFFAFTPTAAGKPMSSAVTFYLVFSGLTLLVGWVTGRALGACENYCCNSFRNLTFLGPHVNCNNCIGL